MEWSNTGNESFKELMNTYLPERIRQAVSSIQGEYIAQLEEIRIRKSLPLMGVFANDDYFIGEKGFLSKDSQAGLIVSSKEIESLFLRLCEHSIYAYEDEISKGFITLRGGHRAGICGTVVYGGEKIAAIKDISSVNIRFSRQIKGCAKEVFLHLIRNSGDIYNTLILSPPRLGKTTMLRDLCRIISQGIPKDKFCGLRTAVVDERSELAATYRGIPQNDLGPRTDVMDGCRKSEGIEIMLRGMAPQVIVVDELGASQDAEAVRRAWNAGVRLIATAHAFGLEDFKKRLNVGKLVGENGFERIIILGIDKGKRCIRVMDAYGNKLSFFDQDNRMRDSFCGLYGHGVNSVQQAHREAAYIDKANRHSHQS